MDRVSPCGQVGVLVVVAGAGVPRTRHNIKMTTVAATDLVAVVRIVWIPLVPGAMSNYRTTAERVNLSERHRLPIHGFVSRPGSASRFRHIAIARMALRSLRRDDTYLPATREQ